MSLTLLAAGLLVVAAVVFAAALAIFWAHRRAPKYLVTLEKMTNRNDQPETVRIQVNLPLTTSVTELWKAIERMGLAATSRMQSINQDILDTMAEDAKEIARKRVEKEEERAEHERDKRKIRLARQMGKPIGEITEAMLVRAQRGAGD